MCASVCMCACTKLIWTPCLTYERGWKCFYCFRYSFCHHKQCLSHCWYIFVVYKCLCNKEACILIIYVKLHKASRLFVEIVMNFTYCFTMKVKQMDDLTTLAAFFLRWILKMDFPSNPCCIYVYFPIARKLYI